MQRPTDKVRVLMANEPRAYREVIAETLQALRPGIEVTLAEPCAIEQKLAVLRPHMVICNEASETVRSSVPIWIELYTGHGSRSVVSVGGESSVLEDIQLSDLLSIVDQAELLVQPG